MDDQFDEAIECLIGENILNNIRESINRIFVDNLSTKIGSNVPLLHDIHLNSEIIKIDAAVLYADINGSTSLVDSHSPSFAAKIYKSYLLCAAEVIADQGGVITAYAGDRVMGVFMGQEKEINAVKAALSINYTLDYLINYECKKFYPKDYLLKHTVGIDTSELHVTRIGTPYASDLVWIGRAANYAAKISDLDQPHSVLITADVYDKLNWMLYDKSIWTQRKWRNIDIYSTDYCQLNNLGVLLNQQPIDIQ